MPYNFLEFKNLSFPQGAYQNGSALVVYNLAPVEGYGYVAFAAVDLDNKLSASALDTRARGGITFRVGTADYMFLGSVGRLYHLDLATGTLTNVSQGGGTPYATSLTDWGWSISRWGNGLVATNFVDHVQYKADITNTTAFIDAFTSTTKPKAKFLGLVKNQLFVAHTNEGGTTYPQRVRWGAVDNLFDMEPSPTTQADYQDLLDNYGEITGFAGGEYGLVFKEQAIYKATYVGPPLIYRFDLVCAGIGTRCPGSIVEYKGSVYFWGANGIYRVLPGGAGVDQVPEGIFKQLAAGNDFNFPSEPWPRNITYNKDLPYYVHAVVDPGLGCIYWAFPVTNAKSYVVAVCVQDGRTAIADCTVDAVKYAQWLIPGTYTGTEHAVYAPSGEFSSNKPRTAYAIDKDKFICPLWARANFPPRIVSGMIATNLGKRAVVTSVRPAFFSAGEVATIPIESPATGVRVHEVDETGRVTATNDFTAGANGWYHGKANGPYVAIETTFANAEAPIPVGVPNVCAGWEVVYDEPDSER